MRGIVRHVSIHFALSTDTEGRAGSALKQVVRAVAGDTLPMSSSAGEEEKFVEGCVSGRRYFLNGIGRNGTDRNDIGRNLSGAAYLKGNVGGDSLLAV